MITNLQCRLQECSKLWGQRTMFQGWNYHACTRSSSNSRHKLLVSGNL